MDSRERYMAGLGVQIAVNVNRIDTLEAEVERLREALQVYANEDNWSSYFLVPDYTIRTWTGDFKAWEIAATALEPSR